MKKLAFSLAAALAASLYAYEPEPADGSFVSNGVAFAQRGGLAASDYVVTGLTFGVSDLARKLETERDPTVGFTNGTLYVDGTNVALDPYVPSGDDPVFSNAVVSVVTGASTNDLAALAEIAGLPLAGAAGTVGGILMLLVAAVLALRKSKADGDKTYFAAGDGASCTGVGGATITGAASEAFVVGSTTEKVITFTGNGTFMLPAGVTEARLVVVGGGGGGSYGNGGKYGGGGGGGVLDRAVEVLGGVAYQVTVGGGGLGGATDTAHPSISGIGGNGENSVVVIGDRRYVGMGGVGANNKGDGTATSSQMSGRCPGWEITNLSMEVIETGGAHSGNVYNNTQGAGGASSAANAVAKSYVGRDGTSVNVTGLMLKLGAGGGGSSAGPTATGSYGVGGADGGGAGGNLNHPSGMDGEANTGSGGGGGSHLDNVSHDGGAGGSGVVYVRYTQPATLPRYGIAIGQNAKSFAAHAIQLGEGENSEEMSFKVHGWTMLQSNGKIPQARLPQMPLTAHAESHAIGGDDPITPASIGAATPDDITDNVEDNTTSTDAAKALSANMGRELQEQIQNLKQRGRYLSIWNCTTGLAETSPTVNPYEYKAGDYFIVGTVGDTNYRPSGTSYDKTVPSITAETSQVQVNDTYYFDGESWTLLHTQQASVAFGSLAGSPSDNAALVAAFAEKQDVIDDLDDIREGSQATQKTYFAAGIGAECTGVDEGEIVGGNVRSEGNERIVTWTGAGSIKFPGGVTSARVLLVGGGGAGATGAGGNPSFNGKGGKGGEVVEQEITVAPGSAYGIAVGAGGAATASTSGTVGEAGDASTITLHGESVVSAEGGAGGLVPRNTQKNAGADGTVSSITGVETYYGGGGGDGGVNSVGMPGGQGGGGWGGPNNAVIDCAGTDGFGGGGGGGDNVLKNAGGKGGDGIVIIRYTIPPQSPTGIAIGLGAQSKAAHAMQIGEGENSEPMTVKFHNYTILNADGKIPAERLPPAEVPSHAATHASDGDDPIVPEDIGAVPAADLGARIRVVEEMPEDPEEGTLYFIVGAQDAVTE